MLSDYWLFKDSAAMGKFRAEADGIFLTNSLRRGLEYAKKSVVNRIYGASCDTKRMEYLCQVIVVTNSDQACNEWDGSGYGHCKPLMPEPKTTDKKGRHEHLKLQHLSKWQIYRFQLPHICHQPASEPPLDSQHFSLHSIACEPWVARTAQ